MATSPCARASASRPQQYVVHIESSVVRGGNYVTALPAWPAGFGDPESPAAYAAQTIDFSNGEKIERLKPDKKWKEISNGNMLHGPFEFFGPADQYFAAVFLPDSPRQASAVDAAQSDASFPRTRRSRMRPRKFNCWERPSAIPTGLPARASLSVPKRSTCSSQFAPTT